MEQDLFGRTHENNRKARLRPLLRALIRRADSSVGSIRSIRSPSRNARHANDVRDTRVTDCA